MKILQGLVIVLSFCLCACVEEGEGDTSAEKPRDSKFLVPANGSGQLKEHKASDKLLIPADQKSAN